VLPDSLNGLTGLLFWQCLGYAARGKFVFQPTFPHSSKMEKSSDFQRTLIANRKLVNQIKMNVPIFGVTC
jgi:hypothetical protein